MGFWLESGKIYNINDNTCLFHFITLAGSLGRFIITWPNGLAFKHLPQDRQMIMHEKTCVIPLSVLALSFISGITIWSLPSTCSVYKPHAQAKFYPSAAHFFSTVLNKQVNMVIVELRVALLQHVL